MTDAIDITWLRKTFDDDSVLVELYTMYVGDTTKRLVELHAALDAQNATQCSRTAHALKGSSGNVGAGSMRELAARLEKHDWTADPAAGAALVQALDSEFARVRDFVDQFTAAAPVAK